MINAMEDYVRFCQKLGVSVEKLFAERESVEKGILEMISLYRIEKLVMGAAADKSYCRGQLVYERYFNLFGFCYYFLFLYVCAHTCIFAIVTMATNTPPPPPPPSPSSSPLQSLVVLDTNLSLHIHKLTSAVIPHGLVKLLKLSGDGLLWFL